MIKPSNQTNWEQMIERYNQELMAQYARAQPTIDVSDNTSELNEKEPSTPPIQESERTAETALDDVGYLQVRITTENQAVPIVGAVVTVTHNFGEGTMLDITEVTDENGQTSVIPLATKNRQLSLHPGTVTPYASYTVEVVADGYFKKRFEELPIYGGVTAFQNVSMIPLPESGDQNEAIDYPPPTPVLS